MAHNRIEAAISLRIGDRLLIGRDRIRLLQAVAEHGNITRAAKAAGASYKTTWDAVQAINQLLPRPAFLTSTGGDSGGGAEATPEGLRLIAALQHFEDRLSEIATLIARHGLGGEDEALLQAFGAQVSTRNVFSCEVVAVRHGRVDVDLTLRASDTHTINAVVTNAAAASLQLKRGRRALALIKAPFVNLAPAPRRQSNSMNAFIGSVRRRVDDGRRSEIQLDIGAGQSMTAVMPRRRADALALREESTVRANFHPNSVIIAAH